MITPANLFRKHPLTAPMLRHRLSSVLAGCVTIGLLWIPCGSTFAQDPALGGPPPQSQAPATGGAPQFTQPLPPALPPGGAETPLPSGPPMHPEVAAMPGIHSEVTVIQHRSQLVVTRSRITQIAVADPNIIDVVQHSPTELSVLGQSIGSTTLTIWFEKLADPLIYLVKCQRDPSLDDQTRVDYGKLEKKIAMLFPNSKVYLIPISGKIVVKGQARDSEEATNILQLIRGEAISQNGGLIGPNTGREIANSFTYGRVNAMDLASSNIINMLQIPGDFQIMLHVVIAELKRSDLRNLVADAQVSIKDGRHILASSLGGATSSTVSAILEQGDVSILLNALHGNTTGKILAEPSVVTLSGHDATILSGGEFAVPTIVGIQGTSGQQTVFRGFGVSMVVTPTIIKKDLIRMRIRPEYSELNAANTANGIPGLNTRRVDTTVELREGQTIVLGGLFSNQSSATNRRIPYLSAIPWVGPALFSSKASNRGENELLILVTPEIVRPLEADEVPPVPGFDVTMPDDRSLYLRGMTEGPNDSNVYQLAPYGHGSGSGIPVGHGQFNPAPSSPGYAPIPNQGMGDAGMSSGANNRYGNPPSSGISRNPTPIRTPSANNGSGSWSRPQQVPRTANPQNSDTRNQTTSTFKLPTRSIRTIGGTKKGSATQAGYDTPEDSSRYQNNTGWGR